MKKVYQGNDSCNLIFFLDSSYGLRQEIEKGHWSGGVIQKIITLFSIITGLRIELANSVH